MATRRIVAALAIVALAIVACTLTPAATTTPTPSATTTFTPTATIPAPTPSPAAAQTLRKFTIIAEVLHERNADSGIVVAYLQRGGVVACALNDDGWCYTDSGTKVWAGCLDPNPQKKGCSHK